MFLQYVRSLNGKPFQPMFDADKGGGSGGGSGAGEGGGNGGGKDDDKGTGEGGNGGTGDPDKNSLDELLKDPAFKAQYESKLKEQLGSRMKKFDGVDVEKYKAWEQAELAKKDAELSEAQKLQKKIEAYEAQQAQVQDKLKDVAIKEYAIDSGMDSKLIARLIDKSGIKLAENGADFEGIKEAVEQVKTEFPTLFQSDEGADDKGQGNSKGGFRLPNQKGNPEHKTKGFDAGKARAEARHKKQD